MTNITSGHIFSGLSAAGKREVFRTLARGKGFRIERIVSRGQKTPEGEWLRSKEAEWVMVLRGRARLLFRKSRKKYDLAAGDHVFIPADTCHRVEWTHPRQKTVWLAVHIRKERS